MNFAQILQTTIDGLKSLTGIDFVVFEGYGKVVAATEDSGESTDLLPLAKTEEEYIKSEDCWFFKVANENTVEYVLGLRGEGENIVKLGRLAVFQIQSLMLAYKERFNRDNFIQNLILGNLAAPELYNLAKKLHIDTEARRVVYIVEVPAERSVYVVEILKSIFPQKNKDFIIVIDDRNIALVKELREKDSEKPAKNILGTISSEIMIKVRIGIGSVICELKELPNSFGEAKTALEISRIFEPEKNIVNADKLGIGRLVHGIGKDLCRTFVREIMKEVDLENFDEETIVTIHKFFENNLNVSETARQLYIHRNTLVYRLDKLQKITGLDLRVFDDAITFKIAMLVNRFINYKLQ
ncbi:hypothetical protein AGMMS49975_05730 [Clostridia bacterium]|nr:hypothetical protein AGMMS49975_05730 [Clostridia bacterium]